MNASWILRMGLLPALAIAVGSCSEEGLNEFVEAEMYPSSPSVILVDTTIGSGDDTFDVPAPWFAASFSITNNHDEYTLVIPALQLSYRGFKNGALLESTTTYTASDACSIVDGEDRVNYAEVAPNTTFTGDYYCDNTYQPEVIYLGGLPKESGDELTVRNYQVEVNFEGYFKKETDQDQIKGRVQKIRYYQTR